MPLFAPMPTYCAVTVAPALTGSPVPSTRSGVDGETGVPSWSAPMGLRLAADVAGDGDAGGPGPTIDALDEAEGDDEAVGGGRRPTR